MPVTRKTFVGRLPLVPLRVVGHWLAGNQPPGGALGEGGGGGRGGGIPTWPAFEQVIGGPATEFSQKKGG